MKTRLEGAALLALCAFAMHRLYLLVHFLPRHQPTLPEMGLSLVVVLTGFAGTAMLGVGPALFQVYRWPPRDSD